ncbi:MULTISPECIES: hypothetical protein [Pseudomonas]|uniref:hypothetical protein n=1 Tax=Pseudomonas TaxID=286 RepID=UPI000AB94999|nr:MULTISPECIES: hypothetical protein [Pseudomonas]MBF8787644.1 hypothetical protein [Pseudomonas asiatica]QUN67573.1 hypothetical protein KDB76_27735 [Pseudomonas sp. JS425]
MSQLKNYLSKKHSKTHATRYVNRRRGGDNNEKGNSFENEFAIHLAAKLFKSGEEAAVLKAQSEDFVDDVVYEDAAKVSRDNYQLKNSPTTRWGSGIADDFAVQHDVNLNYHKVPNSRTLLVVSDQACHKKLSGKIPAFISDHASCIHFKADEFNALLVANDPQVQPFKDLCVFPDHPDKVTVVWQAMAGSWHRNKKASATVEKIVLDAARGYEPIYFKLPTPIPASSATQISANLESLLDKISGLSYKSEDGFLLYSIKGCVSDSIRIGSDEMNEFEKVLSEHEVTDWIQLIDLIGRGDV